MSAYEFEDDQSNTKNDLGRTLLGAAVIDALELFVALDLGSLQIRARTFMLVMMWIGALGWAFITLVAWANTKMKGKDRVPHWAFSTLAIITTIVIAGIYVPALAVITVWANVLLFAAFFGVNLHTTIYGSREGYLANDLTSKV